MPTDAEILSTALEQVNLNNPLNDKHQEEAMDGIDARILLQRRMQMVALPLEWKQGISLMVFPCGHAHRLHIVHITCRITEQAARSYSCAACKALVLQKEDLELLDRIHKQLPHEPMHDEEFWNVYTLSHLGSFAGASLNFGDVLGALRNALSSLEYEPLRYTSKISEVAGAVQYLVDHGPRDTVNTLEHIYEDVIEMAGFEYEDRMRPGMQDFLQKWKMRVEALLKARIEKEVNYVADVLSNMMKGAISAGMSSGMSSEGVKI